MNREDREMLADEAHDAHAEARHDESMREHKRRQTALAQERAKEAFDAALKTADPRAQIAIGDGATMALIEWFDCLSPASATVLVQACAAARVGTADECRQLMLEFAHGAELEYADDCHEAFLP